ncbi:MBL fold metallo-hydrolase [Candidatus Solincola sp.]
MESRVIEIGEGIHLIDCFFAGMTGQCGVYLLRGEKTALVESGPSTGVEHVLAGLAELGIDGTEMDYVLLTHIHLDHAGGAAFLLQYMPKARVLVDGRSARYLVEPEKLVRSAGKALGVIAPHYGTMYPVSEERIIPLHDGFMLDLGEGMSLQAVHTPGHSHGHYAFFEPHRADLFCGDALGHFLGEDLPPMPATPSPEFDPELSLASARRLRELSPKKLLFTHFGSTSRTRETIDLFMERLQHLVRVAEKLRGMEDWAERLSQSILEGLSRLSGEELELLSGIARVNARGIMHYLNRKSTNH